MLSGRVNSRVRVVPALPQEGSVMDLFARIFDEEASLDSSEDYTIPINEGQVQETMVTPEPSPFLSFVKNALVYGAPDEPPQEEPAYVESATDWSYDEDEESFAEEATDDDDDDDFFEEALEEEDEDLEESTYPLVEEPKLSPQPDIVQHTASEQRDDPQVERIVDHLFDRMNVVWGDKTKSAQQPQAPVGPPKPSTSLTTIQRNALIESKNAVAKTIRAEIPRAMKGEVLTLLRKEILSTVRSELVRVIRDEFGSMNGVLTKITEHLHAMGTRIAKMEGNLEKEVIVKFPKGAVRINAPVTVNVPEREVKIAAPINVQPPSVVFDEGAISVQFNRGGKGSRQVKFVRDRYDNIQGAEISDAPER